MSTEKDSKRKSETHSQSLVKHAFESVVSRGARLASYASAKGLKGGIDIYEKQDVLALDDLLVFSIHARRLIETAHKSNVAKAAKITLWGIDVRGTSVEVFTRQNPISFWKLVNSIIHSVHIEMIRNTTEAAIVYGGVNRDDPYALIKGMRNIKTKCLIISDRKEKFIVDLKQMIEVFANDVLDEVIEHWEDKNLYLSVFFKSD